MSTLNPHHERRLLDESALIKSRLRRLARLYGASGLDDDLEAHRLNYEGAFDIVGLVALRARMRSSTATLVSAPGIYMHPARRRTLLSLVAEANARGVRTVLVYKRALQWRARRLETAVAAPTSPVLTVRRAPAGGATLGDRARRRLTLGAPPLAASRPDCDIPGASDLSDAAVV